MKSIEQVVFEHKVAERSGSQSVMYGYCKMSEAWYPRSKMLSMNVKMFDENGECGQVKLRLTPDMWRALRGQLEELSWDNKLLPLEEIPVGDSIIHEEVKVEPPVRAGEETPWWMKSRGFN